MHGWHPSANLFTRVLGVTRLHCDAFLSFEAVLSFPEPVKTVLRILLAQSESTFGPVGFPMLIRVWLSKPMGGWIGMFTAGTIWLLTHGYPCFVQILKGSSFISGSFGQVSSGVSFKHQGAPQRRAAGAPSGALTKGFTWSLVQGLWIATVS